MEGLGAPTLDGWPVAGPWLQPLLTVWLIAAVVMTALWARQLRTRDATEVDVVWAGALGTVALAGAALGSAPPLRAALLALLGGGWGLRLAWHLGRDRIGAEEDGRYAELRRAWGEGAALRFFFVYQLQALLIGVLSTPFVLTARNGAPELSALELGALTLWAVALAGEALADRQLARFRADPANRGRTCRAGLWRTSRHPNYFCEWLVWCAFALLAWPAPSGPWALLAPAVLLVSILKLTGIPPTEAQALRSRGDDYRAYQRETNACFPWFPRRGVA